MFWRLPDIVLSTACILILAACSTSDDPQNNSPDNDAGDICDQLSALSPVADIWPGIGSSNPQNLRVIDQRLYFQANDGVNGEELWALDPTWRTANLIADIAPGSAASSPYGFIEARGGVVFYASDGELIRQLWFYDRETGVQRYTAAGLDFTSGLRINSTLALHDELILAGSEILVFRGDVGEAEPTALVSLGYPDFSEAYVVDNKVYFVRGWLGSGPESEIWIYDPADAEQGVQPLHGLLEGNFSGTSHFPVLIDNLFLVIGKAPDGSHNFYIIDPSDSDIAHRQLLDSNSPPFFRSIDEVTVLNDQLYFVANDGLLGSELWTVSVNADRAQATLVADLWPGDGNGTLGELTISNQKLYFRGRTPDRDDLIYEFDPFQQNAVPHELVSLAHLNNIGWRNMTFIDGVLYLPANDNVLGQELWAYDPACAL